MKKVQVAMLAFLLALSSTFIGCGSSSPTDVAKEYFAAIQKGDKKKMESLSTPKESIHDKITANGKIKLTPEQEADYTKKMEELADKFLKAFQEQLAGAVFTVKEETIDGEKAVVKGTLLKEGKESEMEFKLVKINEEWKVKSM